MNKKILINLKDWFNLEENERYAKEIKNLNVIVFPSILYLYLYNNEKGVQDFNYERGAHTGKISLSRLVEFGIKWALINHRENKVKDTNELISKIECALSKKVKPIVCLDNKDEISYKILSIVVLISVDISIILSLIILSLLLAKSYILSITFN